MSGPYTVGRTSSLGSRCSLKRGGSPQLGGARAKNRSRWLALLLPGSRVALIIALLVSLAFEDYGGNALLGTTWLALGYMLWSRSGATSTPLRG
jgi:hypothetical protein